MAVAVVMEFEGATLEDYDRVIDTMGYERRGAGDPGGLFHWVTQTDAGLLITDVWESKEIFDSFAAEKLGPTTAELGIAPPSSVRLYDVYNYFTAGAPIAA
jgi:hypothetical protein